MQFLYSGRMSEVQLSKLWWLWLPIVALIAQMGLEAFVPNDTLSVLLSETGPHELIQFLLALLGFIMAVRILALPQLKTNHFLYVWVGIAALATLYISGEEMSWGQHILKWGTPEYWATVNDQGETNLHNTSSWLDQKPRLVLELGVVIGGIIIPLLQRFKPKILEFLPEKLRIIYPTYHLIVISLLAVLVKIIDKIDEAFPDLGLMVRASEVNEVFLFYFILLYLVLLRRRLILQN